MAAQILAAAVIALQLMVVYAALKKIFGRQPLERVVPARLESQLIDVLPVDIAKKYREKGKVSVYELTKDVEGILRNSLAGSSQSEQVQFRFALLSLKRIYFSKVLLLAISSVTSIGIWVLIGLYL
ncbi:hypothetical protein [Eoetvoesiella caeni]